MAGSVFVGRDAQLHKLHKMLDDVLAGKGQTCFIAGDAGAGKSAMLHEFVRQAQLRTEEVTVLLGRSNAQTGSGEPYLPFMEILGLLTGKAATAEASLSESNVSRLSKVARSSARILIDYAPDIVGAFVPGASLLTKIGKSIAKESGALALLEEHHAPAKKEVTALDSHKIYQQYGDLLVNVAQQSPLIVVLDDMHWSDAASINLFAHLGGKLRNSRVLLLGTYRPNDLLLGRNDERHPLLTVINELKRVAGDVVVDLELAQHDDRRNFIDALLDAEPNTLDQQFRARLLAHTDGHPLFTVELLQSFKENGTLVVVDGVLTQAEGLDWDVLSPRVEGVIEERIGRIEERMRDILIAGSIEGQNFTAQIVAKLQDMSERDILKFLSQELEKRHHLVKEGSTEKIGKNWLSQFSFSHALFQQYLYNDLSERQRMILHGDVAALFEEIYQDQRDTVLMQLARHYDIAGETEKAIECLLRASTLSLRLSAYEEARMQLQHAMKLVDSLKKNADRDQMELSIQLQFSTIYKSTCGWDSPEVIDAYSRALQLCEQLGKHKQKAPILFGLWCIRLMHLELLNALELARQYYDLAQQLSDDDMLLHARIALGNTKFWMGNIPEARELIESANQQCLEQGDYFSDFGQDPGVLTLMFLGFCTWMQGDAEQARHYRQKMLDRAQQSNHQFSLAIALYGAATIDYHLQEWSTMRQHTEQLLSISHEHHFPLYHGLGLVYQGWLKVQDDDTSGVAQMEHGFVEWICKYGGKVTHSIYCVMLTEALQHLHQFDQAIATAERGLSVARECTEHCYEPELLRLHAELLAATGGVSTTGSSVEEIYAQALDLARKQAQSAIIDRIEQSQSGLVASTETGASVTQ